MIGSLQSVVTALKDGARLRARVIGGMSCIEIRKQDCRHFATCGAHAQDIGAAFFCANARLEGDGSCYRECRFDDHEADCPTESSPADNWLAVEGNSFEISFSLGIFSVVKYRKGATAAPPAVASDLDTAMEMAFPSTAHT